MIDIIFSIVYINLFFLSMLWIIPLANKIENILDKLFENNIKMIQTTDVFSVIFAILIYLQVMVALYQMFCKLSELLS